MRRLSNEGLLEAYHTAVQLRLDADFIELLLAEIYSRGLSLESFTLPAESSPKRKMGKKSNDVTLKESAAIYNI